MPQESQRKTSKLELIHLLMTLCMCADCFDDVNDMLFSRS
jgi:hypothetical protein